MLWVAYLTNITLGGYFIVVPTTRSNYMDHKLIPEKFISVSDCICDVLPGSWGISWVSNCHEDMKRAKTLINISDSEFLELEKWVDEEFNKGSFGWPQGFTNLVSAKEFADKFLYNLQEYWILSIGLTQSEKELFLSEEAPIKNMGGTLVYNVLKQSIDLDNKDILGYDLLGYDLSAFHSYLCNGLEKVLYERYHIIPNQYGFYDDYEILLEASEYVSSDEVGAEPALWQPWVIRKEEQVSR